MPSRKTKRQLADEAYQRTEHLAGQLDIDGSIDGAGPAVEGPVHEDLPARCPDCQKSMTALSGWTPLGPSVRSPAIQCGNCGAILQTTEAAHSALREAIRARFAEMPGNQPKPVAQPKRARGAR